MKVAKENPHLVVMEAFHYRFHPVARRVREIVDSGELGKISRIDTSFAIPYVPDSDIRFNVNGSSPKLAGGSIMDVGCYAINILRYLAGEEPQEVTDVDIQERFPGVDQSARAVVKFPSGMIGSIYSDFRSFRFSPRATVEGSLGSVVLYNFLGPFIYHSIEIMEARTGKRKRVEKHYENGASTYEYQLRAFVGAIQGDKAATAQCQQAGSVEQAVMNMKVIDMIYRAGVLQPRQGEDLPAW